MHAGSTRGSLSASGLHACTYSRQSRKPDQGVEITQVIVMPAHFAITSHLLSRLPNELFKQFNGKPIFSRRSHAAPPAHNPRITGAGATPRFSKDFGGISGVSKRSRTHAEVGVKLLL